MQNFFNIVCMFPRHDKIEMPFIVSLQLDLIQLLLLLLFVFEENSG